MRADTLARLEQIARGEIVPTDGTDGTAGTSRRVPGQKGPSFRAFRVFPVGNDRGKKAQIEDGTCQQPDDLDVTERAAIAIELGGVPPAYAGSWAEFQIRDPGHATAPQWLQAVDDAGRFLDEWADIALDLGWRSADIFGLGGLAWFCAGERIRALGPDNAITVSGRIFQRQFIESSLSNQDTDFVEQPQEAPRATLPIARTNLNASVPILRERLKRKDRKKKSVGDV